jgi:hypothetical protein
MAKPAARVAVAASACLLACNALLGHDLGALADAGDDGAAGGDASGQVGADVSPADVEQGPQDAVSTDGVGTEGSASDAGVETGTFCDTVDGAFYCEDFDLTTAVSFFCPYPYVGDSGVLVIDGTNPKSPPGSMRVSVSGAIPGDLVSCAHDLAVVPPSGITLDFDVQVWPPEGGGGAGPGGFRFTTDNKHQDVVAVQTSPTQIGIYEYNDAPFADAATYMGSYVSYAWKPSTWVHLTLDVAAGQFGYRATLKVDGVEAPAFALRSDFEFQDAQIDILVDTAGEQAAYAANVDNLVVRVR